MRWSSSTEGAPAPKPCAGVKGESAQPLELQVGPERSNPEFMPLFVQSAHRLWCLGFSLFPFSNAKKSWKSTWKLNLLCEQQRCLQKSSRRVQTGWWGAGQRRTKMCFFPSQYPHTAFALQPSRAHTFPAPLRNGLGCDRQLCMTQLLAFSMCLYPIQTVIFPNLQTFLQWPFRNGMERLFLS